MKKLKQINLILLVASLLLLFVYPLASKTFHLHKVQAEEHSCADCDDTGPAIDQPIPVCPICDYQLLSFIYEPTFSPSVFRVVYPFVVAPLPEKVRKEPILHFSLRAPPVA